MQGQTEAVVTTDAVKGAFEYKYLDNELVPLKTPVGENIMLNGRRGYDLTQDCDLGAWVDSHLVGAACYGNENLVPSFCSEYIKVTGREVMAVHIARGSSTIEMWLPGTPRYDIIVKKSLAAIKKAKAVDNVFFVWLQGESNAITSTPKEQYKKMIELLCDALKKDIGINKFGVIRVGRFTNDARDDEIILAQDEVCSQNPDFLMLTDIATTLNTQTEHMNPYCKGHYSAKGMVVLGTAAGKTLGEFVKTE